MTDHPASHPPADHQRHPYPGEARQRQREAHQLAPVLPPQAYTPWARRAGALLIDYLLLWTLAAVVAGGGGLLVGATGASERMEGVVGGVAALVVIAFWVWNWGYRQGVTGSSIGKSALKFKVVDERDGRPIGFGKSVVRQLAHFLDSFFNIGYLMPLFTPKRQTFADMIMGTVCFPTVPVALPPQQFDASGRPIQYGRGRRPGTVTAAAVSACLLAMLNIIATLVSLDSSRNFVSRPAPTMLTASAVASAVFAVPIVWGIVSLLRRRTERILLWACVGALIPACINIAITVTGYHRWLGGMSLGLIALVVLLVRQRTTIDFVEARRTTP